MNTAEALAWIETQLDSWGRVMSVAPTQQDKAEYHAAKSPKPISGTRVKSQFKTKRIQR